jgi:alcohol dehydrogenase class IV
MDGESAWIWRLPPQVMLGRGVSGQLHVQLAALNVRRVMLVADPGVAAAGLLAPIERQLRDASLAVVTFTQVTPEPPVSCLEAARQVAIEQGPCDGVVGIGGGSAMDVAKALALVLRYDRPIQQFMGVERTPGRGLPCVLLPTTAGTGSEVTPIAILTDTVAQLKVGVVSRHLLPDVALVDPALTDTMPPHVTAATGLDALTHAIEAMISRKSQPLSQALALESVRLIGWALPRAFADGRDAAARDDMAGASTLAGIAFASSSCCAVHALAYPLGGRHHVPHGLANALLLAATMRFNAPACADSFTRLASAMGVNPATPEGFVQRLETLCRELRVPASLRSVGVTDEEIPAMAAEAVKIDRLMQPNPRPVTQADAQTIYQACM